MRRLVGIQNSGVREKISTPAFGTGRLTAIFARLPPPGRHVSDGDAHGVGLFLLDQFDDAIGDVGAPIEDLLQRPRRRQPIDHDLVGALHHTAQRERCRSAEPFPSARRQSCCRRWTGARTRSVGNGGGVRAASPVHGDRPVDMGTGLQRQPDAVDIAALDVDRGRANSGRAAGGLRRARGSGSGRARRGRTRTGRRAGSTDPPAAPRRRASSVERGS